MPELPEVEVIKRGLSTPLVGQTIHQVWVREARLRWPVAEQLPTLLAGQQIKQISRRGKYLLLHCTQGHLLIHLGMSGSLRLLDHDAPFRKHEHIEFLLAQQQRLRFHDPRRFGAVLWTSEPFQQHPLLVHLGPEPLEAAFNGEYLYQQAQKHRRTLKSYIMDSHVVVGVGNIYANEALFLAALQPQRRLHTLQYSDYQRLTASIRQVLTAAIDQGGTTLRDFTDGTGQPGNFQPALQVYGRAGKACERCGHQIHQQRLHQRATYFCPHCQL